MKNFILWAFLLPIFCSNLWAQMFDLILELDRPFFNKNLNHKSLWEKERILSHAQLIQPSSEQGQKRLYMKSIGVIKAPVKFVFTALKNFKAYPTYSQFIEFVRVDPLLNVVHIQFKAFNYVALLKIKFFENWKSPHEAQLFGEILEGVFKGMKFQINTVDAQHLGKGWRKTRVHLKAVHAFHKLAVPELFVRFGFEIVLEKVSKALKVNIEKKYVSALNKQ